MVLERILFEVGISPSTLLHVVVGVASALVGAIPGIATGIGTLIAIEMFAIYLAASEGTTTVPLGIAATTDHLPSPETGHMLVVSAQLLPCVRAKTRKRA